MRVGPGFVLILLAAGCVSPAADLPAPLPELALVADAPVRISASQPAREPSIVEGRGGALFVAGYWGAGRYTEAPPGDTDNALLSPLAWRSRDGGATWARLPTGHLLTGAQGNSDVSLAVAPDGRLWYAALVFRPVFLPLGFVVPGAPYGATVGSVFVGTSDDDGDSWRWTEVVTAPYVDRPWIAVAPDGSAHLVWNDGEGIHHAASPDGARWSPARRILDEGGAGGFAASPDGALAARVVPVRGSGFLPNAEADGVLVSRDGSQWELRAVPGARPWAAVFEPTADGVPRVWDPVAFDGQGRLCAAWAEPERLLVACSGDLGETWEEPRTVADGADGQPYFPYLRGAPDGLVASWFAERGGTVSAHAARVTPDAVRPVVLSQDTGGSDHAEYFEVLALGDGLAAAVPRTEDAQWLEFVRARVSDP